ncbi:MAG: hypothetical protein LBT50_01325 [Prevotellaceae bacterium]|nr:hypothetical protein [Prevotellaceae bacterium]
MKKKIMNYGNLRNKTVFDFTRDEKILKKVLSETRFEDYMENPDETIKEYKDFQISSKCEAMVEFSKIINDNKLYTALEREFKNEYSLLFWKPGELLPN